jgi:hypothetical protein
VVAALSAWHEHHEAAAEALAGISALPAHVVLEAYSVVTRLPGGLAVPPASASEVLAERFPARPLTLPVAGRRSLVASLANAGVVGGASYDGLVALEAAAHEQPLLTLDRRAQDTYQRLGVTFRVIAS